MNDFAYQYDEEPYELINGEEYMMSSPSTNHVTVNGNLHNIFSGYLKGKRCRPFSGLNLFLDDKNYYIPDEMIVCNPDIIEDDGVHGAADLVVEILSKSTAHLDKFEKIYTYERCGIREYWIVDPQNKWVEVYLLKDGKYENSGVYTYFTDKEYGRLTARQKTEVKSEIKVSLYDDLIVKVEDIFENVK